MVGHSEIDSSGLKVSSGTSYPQPFLRFAFYALIFSIPYETLGLGIEIRNFTLTKLVGYGFLGVALLHSRISLKLPSPAFFYFSMYLYIYALRALNQGAGFDEAALTHFFTLVQMFVLFWIFQNMMAHADVAKGFLLTIGLSTLSLAVMVMLGNMGTSVAQGRVSALGENPNVASAVLSVGLLALVGLANSRSITNKKVRWMTWFSFGILAMAIVQSGSRGVMAALVVGLLVLAMKDGVLRINLKAALLVFLTVVTVIVTAYQSEAVRARWERTLNTGEVALRGKIIEHSVEMINEKPLIGWGPVAHNYELGSRLGGPVMDTHNIYLWVLQEVGLLGAVPFFVGLWLCCREAWRARVGVHGPLPMAMIIFFLLINMSSTYLYVKLLWVVLAYAIASGSSVRSSNLVTGSSRKRVLATS